MSRWVGRAAGVAVLVVLALRLGSDPFVDGLAAVGPVAIATALTVGVLTTVAGAWRWRLVARSLGLHVPLTDAVAACYRAQLLNSTLPGGVLGDVHRAVDRGRRDAAAGPGRTTGRAVRSVAWERGLGQLVQVGLTLAVLRLWLPALLAAGVLVAALVRFRPLRVALGIAAASVVTLAGYAVMFVVAASATGPASPLPPVPVVLLVLLAAAVPLNVGGWGPREGAAAWAFAAAGLGAEQGVAASVTYGVMALVATLPGLLPLIAPAPEVSRARASA